MKKFISVILSIVLVMSLTACTDKKAAWQEQYDLGLRYLSDLDYENAIQAFNEAIKIDPKQAAAYISLADVYIAQGDLSRAGDVLSKAEESVSDKEEIKEITGQLPDDIYSSGEDIFIKNPDGSPKYNIYYDNGIISSVIAYNGDSIIQTFYNENGQVERVATYIVDGNGRDIKIIETVKANYNSRGEYFEEYTFINEYIYTDGSPVVVVKADIEQSGRKGHAEITYTMDSRDHSININSHSWDDSNPINLNIDSIAEFFPDGSYKISEFEEGVLVDSYMESNEDYSYFDYSGRMVAIAGEAAVYQDVVTQLGITRFEVFDPGQGQSYDVNGFNNSGDLVFVGTYSMDHRLQGFLTYEYSSEYGCTYSKAFYPDGCMYYYRIDYDSGEYEVIME